MHESFFSYNVTRPYPFKWFTPVVLVLGVIATALVSLLNVATAGYDSVAVASAQPNQTVSAPTWGTYLPSFLVGADRATCAASTIPINAQVHTTNSVLTYTVEDVWQENDGDSRNNSNLGSLVYHNNVLQSCNVTQVIIDMEALDRDGIQIARAAIGAVFTTRATCSIETDSGTTYVQLRAQYDANPPLTGSGSILQRANATNHPSLYWGESLLYMYWLELVQNYANETLASKSPLFKGVINLARRSRQEQPATFAELMSPDFFSVLCYMSAFPGNGFVFTTGYCRDDSISNLTAHGPLGSIWSAVDVAGKAMYFLALADLGRDDDAMPNMLARPELLANLSSGLGAVERAWNASHPAAALTTQPGLFAQGSFNASSYSSSSSSPANNNASALGTAPAFLATNYFCQVPRLKSPGTLFMSVLVADLVILQGLWTVLRWAVDHLFVNPHPERRACSACAECAARRGSGLLAKASSSSDRGSVGRDENGDGDGDGDGLD